MVTLTLDRVGVALGRRPVVRDVSAAFAAGTLTGIVGPNGAGKSTLARAMLALVPATGAARASPCRGRTAARGSPASPSPSACRWAS